MEKKDIRSDLLKSFGMESRAFTWLEEIKRNVSSDEKMYNLTVGSPDGMPEDEIHGAAGARAWKSHLCLAVRQH